MGARWMFFKTLYNNTQYCLLNITKKALPPTVDRAVHGSDCDWQHLAGIVHVNR